VGDLANVAPSNASQADVIQHLPLRRLACYDAAMQTRIGISRVGTGLARPAEYRSFGPADSRFRIDLLNGFARQFNAYQRDGVFSLKWFPRGSARYGVDRLHHRLAGDKVLLLQAGQPYEIEFLDRRGTESFCLFFSEALMREALAAGEFDEDGRDRLQYVDMVFTPSDGLTTVLTWLRSHALTLDKNQGRAEEILLSLLAELTLVRRDHQRLAAAIPARRPGTRRRLLGSVQRAKEMIDDHVGRPPPLEELARATGLSKFHLLRTFKAAFNASPMEYAERRRIERSQDLLRRTSSSVGAIAERLGWESQSAFAKAFRRHVGVTPRVFRAD
jgi:AraC-like DNA-binding protein